MTAAEERPILFNGEMMQAILAGKKTQTRRVIKKSQPGLWGDEPLSEWRRRWLLRRCPYGISGDHLWVRETWRISGLMYDEAPAIQYRADGAKRDCDPIDGPGAWGDDKYLEWCQRQWAHMAKDCAKAGIEAISDGIYLWTAETNPNRWHSPRFMPRWASRLTLEIASVRAERLQDITAQDCFAEGWPRHLELFPLVNTETKALRWFKLLWDALNAKRGYGWRTNPLAWVIGFKLLR